MRNEYDANQAMATTKYRRQQQVVVERVSIMFPLMLGLVLGFVIGKLWI